MRVLKTERPAPTPHHLLTELEKVVFLHDNIHQMIIVSYVANTVNSPETLEEAWTVSVYNQGSKSNSWTMGTLHAALDACAKSYDIRWKKDKT